MVPEALAALAAAGGTAVVEAAVTDAWPEVRGRVARMFGRGDGAVERAELRRLDRTADTLAGSAGNAPAETRVRQETAWQTRFECLLDALPADQREAVAAELRSLVQAVPVADQATTVNMITGGTQHGSVVQGRDFHGPMTFHPPGRAG